MGAGKGAREASGVQCDPRCGCLAEEHNIDLAKVTGTGKDGRILKSDVEALL